MITNDNQSQPLFPRTKPSHIAYLMCVLGALFYCYEFFLRVSPSVMSDELMSNYHLTAGTFGNLSACYYYAYTPMQIIVGILMDRFGTRILLTLACFICALGTYLFACSDVVYIAQIGRFLVGLGSAFAFVGALKLITLWLPPERFALGSGVIVALGSVGAMAGDIALTSLVNYAGWRETNMIAVVCGIILALVLGFALRDGDAHCQHDKTSTNVKFSDIFKGLLEALKSVQMWKAGIVGCLLYLPTSAFAELWAIPYLEQARHFSSREASTAVSMVFLGWVIGGPLSGLVSDYLKRRLAPMFVGGLLCLVAFAYIFFMPTLSVTAVHIVFLLFGICVSSQIIVFAVARESSQEKISGTAIALMNFFVMIGGAVFQPVIGILLDMHWSGEVLPNGVHVYSAANFNFALSVLPIGVVVALITIFFMKETHGKLRN